jgi:hypothetical protein
MQFLDQYLDFKYVTQIGLISDSESSGGALNRVVHEHCLVAQKAFSCDKDTASTTFDVVRAGNGQQMRANAIVVL